jgi:hypothetical protein
MKITVGRKDEIQEVSQIKIWITDDEYLTISQGDISWTDGAVSIRFTQEQLRMLVKPDSSNKIELEFIPKG